MQAHPDDEATHPRLLPAHREVLVHTRFTADDCTVSPHDLSLAIESRFHAARDHVKLRRALVGLLVLLALWFASGLLVGRLLTARMRPHASEPSPSTDYESLRLHTTDGLAIGAWLRVHEDERAAVILVHGNGASRSSMIDDAQVWFALGCTVMPISVRAHGDSEGERNDAGWSARRDVQAAITHLCASAPERRIILHGMSLGSAASLFAAAEDPDVAGLVLIGPYGTLRDAIRARTQRALPWGVEALAYYALLTASPIVLPELDQIRPLNAARHVRGHMPMLIVAGERDRRAPFEVAYEMAEGHSEAEVILAARLDHEQLSGWIHSAGARAALRHLLDTITHRI